jgi:hypothetical protein
MRHRRSRAGRSRLYAQPPVSTTGPGGCHVAVRNQVEEPGGVGKAKASARRSPRTARDQWAVGPWPRVMTMSWRTQPSDCRPLSIVALTVDAGAVSVNPTFTRSSTQPACELGSIAHAPFQVAAIGRTETPDAPGGTADLIVSRLRNTVPPGSPPSRWSAVSAYAVAPMPPPTTRTTIDTSRTRRGGDEGVFTTLPCSRKGYRPRPHHCPSSVARPDPYPGAYD